MINRHETYEPQDRSIKVRIQSTRGKKEFSFPKLTKVADVIKEAADAFGFVVNSGDQFELVLATKPDESLEPQRTLASYPIEDGDVLILTSIGGGV